MGGASSLSLPFHHVQPSAHGVAARPVAGAHQRRITPDVVITFQGGSRVAYTDQVLTCADCGIDFVFSASEQEFFAQKGFTSAPKRCPSCRAQRRASGGGNYGNGGSYGEGGGSYSRGPREMFDAVCARCGKDTQVPFRPTGARPVYCSDCFRLMRG